jgi:hypothetical protein
MGEECTRHLLKLWLLTSNLGFTEHLMDVQNLRPSQTSESESAFKKIHRGSVHTLQLEKHCIGDVTAQISSKSNIHKATENNPLLDL